MRRKILFIVLTIVLVACMIGGGTMAWFTAKAQVDNTFTAGTVMIEAGDEVIYSDNKTITNVNPGDAFKKCIEITNTGSKEIELRLSGFELAIDIDWEWISENWDALCFSEEFDNCQSLQAKVEDAMDAPWNEFKVTNPVWASGIPKPNNPFDANERLINPLMAAPTPISGWIMKYVDGETMFFYTGGPLEPGESTTLCVVVVFDGPWMGNLWQGATFTMNGTFEAVQASNDAPRSVWGDNAWSNYLDVKGIEQPRDQLAYDFEDAYADYFYDDYIFKYAYLCEMTNGNGDWFTEETAFGGETPGGGEAWWFYFDMTKGDTQTITAGQHYNAGTVTITVVENGDEYVTILIELGEGWDLLQGEDESVKIGGYNEIPDNRPAGGSLDLYKGADTIITLIDDPVYNYYVIHLDLEYEGPELP